MSILIKIKSEAGRDGVGGLRESGDDERVFLYKDREYSIPPYPPCARGSGNLPSLIIQCMIYMYFNGVTIADSVRCKMRCFESMSPFSVRSDPNI